MQKKLLTSNLRYTTEYEFDTHDILTITELSSSGVKTKTHSLFNLEATKVFSRPRIVNLLVIILVAFLLAISLTNYQAIEPLSNISMSITLISFGFITGCLFFVSPNKYCVYSDSFTGKVIFKLKLDLKNSLTNSFIYALNSAIDISKNTDPELDNIMSNTKLEYETNLLNVNKLLNSGMIDESLYNRINSSMRESVFGVKSNEALCNNVVYINR